MSPACTLYSLLSPVWCYLFPWLLFFSWSNFLWGFISFVDISFLVNFLARLVPMQNWMLLPRPNLQLLWFHLWYILHEQNNLNPYSGLLCSFSEWIHTGFCWGTPLNTCNVLYTLAVPFTVFPSPHLEGLWGVIWWLPRTFGYPVSWLV